MEKKKPLNISQKVSVFLHRNEGARANEDASTQEMNINHISFCVFFFLPVKCTNLSLALHMHALVSSQNEFYNAFNCQL